MCPKAVVLLLLCCIAGTVGIALSQEQTTPAAAPTPAPSDAEAVRPDSVVVAIPSDGEFYFAKVRVAEADIPEKAKEALKDKPPEERIVYIKAAVSVRYGTVVSVMDAIRAAGFDRIGLVTDKKKHPNVKPGPDLKPEGPVNNSSGSSDATLRAAPAVILIDVRSQTRLQLNSKPVLLSRLAGRLQELLAGRSDKTVFIKAPRNMSYGDVVKVIDIAKGTGAQPIGLQTERLE